MDKFISTSIIANLVVEPVLDALLESNLKNRSRRKNMRLFRNGHFFAQFTMATTTGHFYQLV